MHLVVFILSFLQYSSQRRFTIWDFFKKKEAFASTTPSNHYQNLEMESVVPNCIGCSTLQIGSYSPAIWWLSAYIQHNNVLSHMVWIYVHQKVGWSSLICILVVGGLGIWCKGLAHTLRRWRTHNCMTSSTIFGAANLLNNLVNYLIVESVCLRSPQSEFCLEGPKVGNETQVYMGSSSTRDMLKVWDWKRCRL